VKYKSLVIKFFFITILILSAHLYSGIQPPGAFTPELKDDWSEFQKRYNVEKFGHDGYFIRAIKNGHALFTKTYDFAWRFTRNTEHDEINSCASCHTAEDMAYGFVNSDRYDSVLKKRISFEERIARCYVTKLNGFIPTVYDPAIRDLRIFSRAVAHHLGLREGQLPPAGNTQ